MQPMADPEPIRLIRASVGNTVKLIPVSEVICLEASDKYVNVITSRGESQVRMSLRELAARLSGIELVQVHRGVMVNLARMDFATRDELGFYNLRLHGLARTIKVSRAFSHLFRPM
jgi:DNA-binding LytR/AlgR family response regulator